MPVSYLWKEGERSLHRVVSQGSHQVITDNSGGHHQVITDYSCGCNMVERDDSGGCHMVITDNSGGCHVVVTDDSACSHLVVTYDILTTTGCHLGHELSRLLSELPQCSQFESCKSPEVFELSLCQKLIAKMSELF
jgi:hypothetical protein